VARPCGLAVIGGIHVGNYFIELAKPAVIWIPEKIAATRFPNEVFVALRSIRPRSEAKRPQRMKPAQRPFQFRASLINEFEVAGIES
jgi:hypothetical protein